jgi:hypothetical protein
MIRASDYASGIRGMIMQLTRAGILTRQSRPIDMQIESGNSGGFLRADRPGLVYQDGAFLRIDEEFLLDEQGVLFRKRYSYHYQRLGGYYLRFEREQHDGDRLYKPEHHLHVCWRLPHFPALLITLLETLDFIRINFYSPYRQRLVGQSLAIQI